MKHRLIIHLVALLALVAYAELAAQNAPVTRIQGQLIGNSIYTEISLRMPTREVSVVTTAKIEGDGKFSMEFPQIESNLYRLFLADNNNLILVLDPGDQVQATLKATNINENPEIKGSQETARYLQASFGITFFAQRNDSINTAWKESIKMSSPDSVQAVLRARYEINSRAEAEFIRNTVLGNLNSLTGLLFIDRLDISDFFEVYDQYDRSIFARYPNNFFVKDFHNRVASERSLAIGQPAPEIRLPDPEGNERALSSLKGKVVLIDFWAAWCGPCRKENPHVVEIYHKYHDKGFEVFGVSLDRDKNAWIKAISDDKLVWTQVSDLLYWKSAAAKQYNVNAIPHTFLIDREGKIIAKKLRGEGLSRKLEEIFGF